METYKKSTGRAASKDKKKCGIIMPIAYTNGYPSGHWKDVLNILSEAIAKTEFSCQLVSNDDAIGLIHDRIVTNIYNNEIVVCDVSSKNPNVMFELGLRLAFDKPTIIIKDDLTDYLFDTGVIEHLSYPSSLRFADIVAFQEELVNKINATYTKSQEESGYSPFLKSFGKTIVAASIQSTEISESHYIIEELKNIKDDIALLRRDKVYNSISELSSLEQAMNRLSRLRSESKEFSNNHVQREPPCIHDDENYIFKAFYTKKDH